MPVLPCLVPGLLCVPGRNDDSTKLEKQQGPESHGRDIDQGELQKRRAASGRHPKGAASRSLERWSQFRTTPKLGKIGTECGAPPNTDENDLIVLKLDSP